MTRNRHTGPWANPLLSRGSTKLPTEGQSVGLFPSRADGHPSLRRGLTQGLLIRGISGCHAADSVICFVCKQINEDLCAPCVPGQNWFVLCVPRQFRPKTYRSPSEIRPHNLTFCRLSISSNRMWGGWHWPGRPREERGRLGQVFQAFWGLHPERKSFSRLCVAQIICHSACTFPSPRSRNLRNPRASLICPKIGSTTAWRSL